MCSLSVNFEWDGVGECGRKMTVQGVVIDCRRTGPGSFETTVFFEYPPAEVDPVACAIPQVMN